MAAAEGAGPILQCGEISPSWHPVVDRHGAVERDAPIGRRVRDEPPLPLAGSGKCYAPNIGPAAVEFRITMVALAEEERVTGAVGDVRQANAAVKKEDAVPAQSGIIRRIAISTRPFAAVAAITAQPIETQGPRRGGGSDL